MVAANVVRDFHIGNTRISAAFGSAITPTLEDASNALAGFVQGIGEFLQENPVLTKIITALGVGLGVVVTGIAGVAFVTGVAIPAVTAFGVALHPEVPPRGAHRRGPEGGGGR